MIEDSPMKQPCFIDLKEGAPVSVDPLSHAMLLVGVLWVLPMLALALLFSDGDELVQTGCRFVPEHGHPTVELMSMPVGYPVLILINQRAPIRITPIRKPPNAMPKTPGRPNSKQLTDGGCRHGWVTSR